MKIDLTKLITSQVDYIDVDIDVSIDSSYISKSSIKRLKNVTFKGMITKLYDGDFQINGTLEGTMVLPDDITLEDVDYNFNSEINENFSEFGGKFDNNLRIIKNILDIQEFLWQNILVEIPLKVVSEKNKNLTLKGDGWRLVTEDELNANNDSNNSPFSELANKFNSREE